MPRVHIGDNIYQPHPVSLEETARRILASGIFGGLRLPMEEVLARMKESLSEEERERIENAGDQELEVFKRLALTILDMYEETLSKAEEKYKEVLAGTGAPKSRVIEKKIKQVREQFNKVRQKLSKLDYTRDTHGVASSLAKAIVALGLVETITEEFYKTRDVVAKLGRGEGITWREARELVKFYDVKDISHLVYPKKIWIPPVRPLGRYAEIFEKLGMGNATFLSVSRRAVALSTYKFQVAFHLDKEIDLPEDVDTMLIDLSKLGEKAFHKIAKHGLEISVTSEGFKAKVKDTVYDVNLSQDLLFYNDKLIEAGTDFFKGSYGVLEYNRETGKLFNKLSTSIKLTSTGDLVVDETPDKIYVLPARFMGLKLAEAKTADDKLPVVDLDGEQVKFLGLVMEQSKGRLAVGDAGGYGLVLLEFTDKTGVKTSANIVSGLDFAWNIEEVNVIKVKPRPYLSAFIKAYTRSYTRILPVPILVTSKGDLLITGWNNLIYMAPEPVELDKPVEINLEFYSQLSRLIDLGIIPVELVDDEETAEKAARAVEIHDFISKAEPVETYQISKTNRLSELAGLPDHVADLIFELNRDLGYKGKAKINVYKYGREGTSMMILEAIIKGNVRIVKILPA